MPAGCPKKATGTVAGAACAGSGLAGEGVGEGVGTGSADGDETGGDGGAAPTPGGPPHAWTTISKAEAVSAHLIAFTQVRN